MRRFSRWWLLLLVVGCQRHSHDRPVDIVLKNGMVFHTRARGCESEHETGRAALIRCVAEDGSVAFIGAKDAIREVRWK